MALLIVLLSLVIVVSVLLLVATMWVVGPERIRELRIDYRERLRGNAVYVGILIVVLAINSLTRTLVPEISWMIGWNLTGPIYRVEGVLVGMIQSYSTPELTAYFAFMYVYGYVFLLVFPLIAYGAMRETDRFRELIIAYIANYSIGLVFYAMFISYGPRNLMPDLVESLLYTTYPQIQFLTTAVNTNTNVFPSLHTSLSVTVAIFAFITRDVYPRWFVIAGAIAVSVGYATMYLGIHWALDVVAGIILAAVSVKIALWHTERRENVQ